MQHWDDKLILFTKAEFNALPDGFELTSINGKIVAKGKDYIDMDTRYGYIAFGVVGPLSTHPEAETLNMIKLKFS